MILIELKIKIRTPPGAAKGFDKNLEMRMIKKMILSKATILEQYTNDDASEMYWLVDVHARNYLKVARNLQIYQQIVSGVFDNKLARSSLKRFAESPEDYEKLVDMMNNGTEIEIIKQASADELVEANKTFWQKMKEKFKRS